MPPNLFRRSRPMPTTCVGRESHLPVGQDAFCRSGSASPSDHGYLPGRFRLDPGLPAAGRANRLVVPQSGIRHRRWPEITNQLEYDDEVASNAIHRLYDLSRGHDPRPWCLTVSFTHPHDPYVARKRFWDMYEDCDHLDPVIGELAFSEHDPHSQRLLHASNRQDFDITAEDVAWQPAGVFRQHLLP